MKIYDIIATEGITDKVFGKVVGKAADAAAPAAEKISAKALKTAKFDQDLRILSLVLGSKANTIIKWAYAAGIVVPMITTANEIYSLNGQLKAGKVAPAEYEKQVQYWLGKCVTEILAIGAFNVALKGGAGILKGIPFLGAPLGNLINKMTPAASAAFSVWLATPGSMGGQESFTKWFVGESFLPGVAEVARNWLGAWVKQGYDALLGRTEQAATNRGEVPKTDAEKELGAFGDIDKPVKSDMQFDAATGQWLNPTKSK